MAQLIFDHKINLTTYEDNPIPKHVHSLMLSNEPKNEMWQYYIDSRDRTENKYAQSHNGNYDELLWATDRPVLTSNKIKRIGIKSFPQVGAVGFYTLLNEERSKIIVPIHAQIKKYASPTLTVQETDTTLIFTMSNPTVTTQSLDGTITAETISYICYRIILRLGDFAVEYVTYEQSLEVSKPPTTGTYDIYCVGYINEGEATSEDSNHITLDIIGIYDVWPGPAENHDLHITDVEVVDDYAVNIRRSDGFVKQTDSTIVHPVSVNFDAAGYMHIILSNGDTIISDNVVPSGGGGGGGGGTTDPVKVINYEYYYGTATSTGTLTYTGQVGNKLLLFITTRGSLLTPPEGWTSLGEAIQLEDSAVVYLQYIQVFVKDTTGKAETISWEQERTNGTWACCIELANAATPVIEDYTKQESVAATNTAITCHKRTNDVMIFATTAVYWTNVYEWVCSSTNIWQIPNDGVTIPRMGIFIDQQDIPIPFTVGLTMSGRYMSGFGIRIPQKESGGGTTVDRMVAYGIFKQDPLEESVTVARTATILAEIELEEDSTAQIINIPEEEEVIESE